jgi:hypothetical protein
MYIYYNTLLALFAICIFIIIIDKNVADYFLLVFKLLNINYQRMIWMIRLHPRNPITNLIKRFEYDKIAKELHKELNNAPIQNKKD